MLDMNIGLTSHVSDTAAANTFAVVDLASPAKPSRWSIGGVSWSYGAMLIDTAAASSYAPQLDTSAGLFMHQTPSTDTTGAANLTTGDTSGTLCFGIDIIEVGSNTLVFAEPVKFSPGMRVQIALKDGGGSHRVSVLGAKLV